jgi:hypothetical protein
VITRDYSSDDPAQPKRHTFVGPGPGPGAYVVIGARRLSPDVVEPKPKPTPHPTANLPPRTVAGLCDGGAYASTVIDWDGSKGILAILGHEGVEVPFHAGVVRGNALDRLAVGLTINASFGWTRSRPGVRCTQISMPSQKNKSSTGSSR